MLPEFHDFYCFLELIEIIETIFESEGIDEFIQLAHFHPNYVFEDSNDEDNDVENYTNRSPYPILHLLKVKDVSNAIDQYDGDTDQIWKRNKSHMKVLGIEKLKQINENILKDAKSVIDNKRND